MSLGVYSRDELNNQFIEHSKNGEFINPSATSHNGSEGEVVERKLFLRNSDNTKWYNNIVMELSPVEQIDENPSAIYKIRLIARDEQPTLNQWSTTPAGQSLSEVLKNAINNNTGKVGSASAADLNFHPFWMRIEVPANSRVQNNRNVRMNVTSIENTVS